MNNTNLILSHIHDTNWETRFEMMQLSLNDLLSKIGIIQIKTHDSKVISNILLNRWNMTFGSPGLASRLAACHKLNYNFSDLMVFMGLDYYAWFQEDYIRKTVDTYIGLKVEGKYESYLPFKDILEPTYGLLLYREQAYEIIRRLTGISIEECKQLIVNFRKGHNDARDFEQIFVKSGGIRGFSIGVLSKAWTELSNNSHYFITQRFIMASCWIIYQIEYLKKYYSEEFQKIISECNSKHDCQSLLTSIQRANGLKLAYPIEY